MLYYLILIFISTTHAQTPTGELNRLVSKALELQLADQVAWQKLGHWQPYFGGYKSDADGDDFFLATHGKTDPSAELTATLQEFFRPATPEEVVANSIRPANGSELQATPQHPVCRFPARLIWLQSQLEFDMLDLAVTHCAKFTDYVARTAPIGASLVFSSYYLENPASIFGHTFLRLHRGTSGLGANPTALTDDGINFGAVTNGEKSALYSIKGLFGFYPGKFSTLAYYYKVREYNDYESRDIWEYKLDLSPTELLMLLAHTWELDSTSFDYYYRTENCSYQLLALLEATKPSLDLLPLKGRSVIPIDTVRAVVETEGLVAEVNFRPSLRRQFEARITNMDKSQLGMVDNLATGQAIAPPENWENQRQIDVLDAAVDLVELRHPEQLLSEEETPAALIKQSILEQRSNIREPSKSLTFDNYHSFRPENGHKTGRLGLGVSTDQNQTLLPTVSGRLVLHDLTDPSTGYPELEHIELFPFELVLDTSSTNQTPKLRKFWITRLTSLTPWNRYNHGYSTTIDVGFDQLEPELCDQCLAPTIKSGSGIALSSKGSGVTIWGLATTSLQYSKHILGWQGISARAAVGSDFGVRLKLKDGLHLTNITYANLWGQSQPAIVWKNETAATLRISKNFAVGGQALIRPASQTGTVQLFWYK